MRVIAKSTLAAYWSKNPETEEPLTAWHKVARKAHWTCPQDIRNTYKSADPVGGEFVVFNILHSDYRLVTRVHYEDEAVYIWGVFTHREYDKLNLPKIDKQLERERLEREQKAAKQK